jgi:hypothetical protein
MKKQLRYFVTVKRFWQKSGLLFAVSGQQRVQLISIVT